MPILGYKYRLKGKQTAVHLCRFACAANQVWNYCVQTQRTVQRARRGGLSPRWPSHFDLTDLTNGTSKDLGLRAQTIQSVCAQFTKSRDLHRRCPRYRSSGGSKRSLGWVPFQRQSRQITSSSVTYLGHTFRFFGAKRRPLPANAKGGCFVEDSLGRWWVCFDVQVPDDKHSGTDSVGIDLGIKTFATLSNGESIDAPRTYRAWEERLATAQRAGNRRRAKAINAKIANIRKDHLHKTSTRLVQNYGAIYVGDVNASGIAKTSMAKSVYDASWSTFRGMLRYKASRHGAIYAEVDERFTTQTCSSCGDLPPERPKGIAGLGIREWDCSSCGANHNRDVNAAKNILALGLSTQPPVEESRVSQ